MEIVYTAYRHKVHSDDDKACAKEIQEKGKPNRYFVLYSNDKKFFSPWELDHQRKKDKFTGLPEWKWIPVQEQTFKWYMDFLDTRNDRLKYMAERYEIFQ